MNAHHIAIAREKLESLKGQLAYANSKLRSGQLQPWEAKEWTHVAERLGTEVRQAEEHLNFVVAL